MELIDHANSCVDFLAEKGMIRPDRSTPFEIDEHGNLVRSHFSGCFTGNCTNPGQPEFNKCWKAENNAGCGCNGKKKNSPCSPTDPNSTITPNATLRVNGCGFATMTSGQTTKFGFNTRTKSQPVC